MDRKNDDSRLLLEQVNDLLENNKILELRELLEEYHTMDILDVMENLDEEMKVKLFEVLPIDVSASILEESGSEFFRTMLSLIDVQHGRNILEQMSLDDLTDILSELEEDERQRIINLLNKSSIINIFFFSIFFTSIIFYISYILKFKKLIFLDRKSVV